jgi:hypothetical protein
MTENMWTSIHAPSGTRSNDFSARAVEDNLRRLYLLVSEYNIDLLIMLFSLYSCYYRTAYAAEESSLRKQRTNHIPRK